MINLLPEQEKKLARDEYRLRVIAVVLCSVLITIGIGVVLLIPSYGLAMYKSRVAQNEAQSLIDTTREVAERAELTKELNTVSSTMSALSGNQTGSNPSSIVALLIKHKTADNKITGFGYEKREGAFVIHVRGIAKTRQSLQSFAAAVRKEKGIDDVVVPVSNFAKDTDIEFTFDVLGK
ncbi:MAG: hypothetical protein V4519_00055 [Patescibacteria group bacterium]